MTSSRNKGGRRFRLVALFFNGKDLDIEGGEILVRTDGTVALNPRGKTGMDFPKVKGWRLAVSQTVAPGARLSLEGEIYGVAQTATVVLGDEASG
jgi:hypothetical protein